jgi:hypothetical protein
VIPPSQAKASNPHANLLNVYIQLANKMGFQQRKKERKKERAIPVTGRGGL